MYSKLYYDKLCTYLGLHSTHYLLYVQHSYFELLMVFANICALQIKVEALLYIQIGVLLVFFHFIQFCSPQIYKLILDMKNEGNLNSLEQQ